jgi:DNA-binding beta-propeller fold protein YncE
LVEEFDGTVANHHIARQLTSDSDEFAHGRGITQHSIEAVGFAVSATGDDYQLYSECSCTLKWGQQLSPLGRADSGEAGDVAVAVDPVTGHVYADDQSSVGEWDTGAMNRNSITKENGEVVVAGTLVSRFGSAGLSGVSGQGGIAVDGATGDVYVSNTGDGKVDVFASDAPAVTVGEPAGVSGEAASLSGTVDPRGAAVSSCEFEYGVTDEFGNGPYNRSVPCQQTPVEIGAGSAPVPVSAELEDLAPSVGCLRVLPTVGGSVGL